jgi:hypothetical protein
VEQEIEQEIIEIAESTSDLQAQAAAVAEEIADLHRVLIAEGLFQRLAEATAPLRTELQDARSKAATLRQDHESLRPRVEASARVLQHEVDKAVAQGLDAEADRLKAEAVRLQSGFEHTAQQAEQHEARRRELEAKIQHTTARVFEENYPSIRTALVTVEQALCGLLDGVWRDMLRYETESGLTGPHEFVKGYHKSDLTPREKGPEAESFLALRRWFAGRQ